MKWIIVIFDIVLIIFLFWLGIKSGGYGYFLGAGVVFIFSAIAYFYPPDLFTPLNRMFRGKK